jgi:hypothetical protein
MRHCSRLSTAIAALALTVLRFAFDRGLVSAARCT